MKTNSQEFLNDFENCILKQFDTLKVGESFVLDKMYKFTTLYPENRHTDNDNDIYEKCLFRANEIVKFIGQFNHYKGWLNTIIKDDDFAKDISDIIHTIRDLDDIKIGEYGRGDIYI